MSYSPLTKLVGTLRRSTEALALDDLSDAELLGRYRATRDESAFAVIVKRHGPLVLAAARQLLSDPADVDDAFQAAWLMFVRESPSIRDGAALSGWLYRVAYRIAVRLKQRQDKRRELGETGAAEPDLSWREACAVLHEELDRLPEKFRLPLVLCYLDGRSRDEAAKQLGWTEGMVKGRLERGRNMLRERLTYRGVTLSAGLLAAIAASRAEAVSPHLVNSISRFLINPAVAPAGLSALCAGVAPTMITPRRWPIAAAIFLIGLLGTGAILLAKPSPKDPPAKPQTAEKPATEALTLSGRVVDAEGKPIEGARLHWPKLSDIDLRRPDEDKITAPSRGNTDKEGRFSIEVPSNDVPKDLPIPLMVLADGYGIGWVNQPPFGGSVDVKLTREHPVKGRAIDTQGKPLAGIEVQIVAIMAPNDGKLDEFLAAFKRDWQMAPRQAGRIMYFPMNKIAGKTKTDADGRFELKNVARGQIAQVEIGGGAASQHSLYVVNEPGFDPAPINKAVMDKQGPNELLPGQVVRLAGPTFEHVAAPTKIIEGVVTDATSGKPLADVHVSSSTGYGQSSRAKTDAQGRFRLAGLNKTREHLVTFNPPHEGTLMMRTIRVPDTEGLTPVRADAELSRGVVLQGQVIDKSTGKGVRAAVRFAPLPDNKYFGKKPGYDTYLTSRTMNATDGDGRFRLVTIPGSGVLMCQAYGGEMVDNMPMKVWLPAQFDDEDRGKIKVDDKDPPFLSFAVAGGGTEFLGSENAVKIVTSEETSGPTTVNLYLNRGVTKPLRIVDADGKPIAGATVSGLTASFPTVYTIKADSCTIYALEPKKTRTIVVLHAQRKLADVVQITGDGTEPVVATLKPTATVKGRLLDVDGNAIGGASVSVGYRDYAGRELIRFVKPTPVPVKTDADGRFEVTGVVAGLEMYLDANKERKSLVGEPRIGAMTLKSGETKDLGDRKMRPAQ